MPALILALAGAVMISSCGNYSTEEIVVNSKEGVQFSATGLGQAIQQSKKENKPIFLLAFAGYCPACKKMKKSIFPDQETGSLFNKGFINAQVDIESEEGQKIVKEYDIEGTPTLLFLTPDGQVLNKASGYHSKEELIALAREVIFDGKPVIN